jgi:hypothetical protein
MTPTAEYAGKRYEPANGTEGEAFHEEWCCKCARDKEMNGTCHAEGREATDEDWCPILAASFRGEATQWIYSAEGCPICTEFVAVGDPVTERDDRTIDMFGGGESGEC